MMLHQRGPGIARLVPSRLDGVVMRPRAPVLAMVAFLLFTSTLEARSKTKRAKRRSISSRTDPSSADDTSQSDDELFYDASDCNGPWDGGTADEELWLDLPDGRCDFEEVSEADFNETVFKERYSLRRPLIVRHSSSNGRAREFIRHRCEVLRRYGTLPVELGDPFSLAKHGRSSKRMSLGKYLETPFRTSNPLYFFDRSGQWSKNMGELSELVSAPPGVLLTPEPMSDEPDRPIIFSVGKSGSGIGLHQHQDAWNQVLLGRKRWTVYSGINFQRLAVLSMLVSYVYYPPNCVSVGQAILVVCLLPQATILPSRT